MSTEESIIESESHNTEDTPNERAEEQRTQSNDNEHETNQLDPTSREATIYSYNYNEPHNEERRPRQRKINTVCNFYKENLVDTA